MGRTDERFDRPFRIGDWCVDPLRLVITDLSGKERTVAQRAMSVLVELARADGGVVRKYDLMHAVWAEAEVGDGALSQPVFELRQAFGDDPHDPAFIETIRGVGFRLIPPVCDIEQPTTRKAAKSIPRMRWLWGLAAGAALIALLAILVSRTQRAPSPSPRDKSVAVLPFEHLGDRQEDRYFTDGIHEELLTQIASLRDVKTISRTSVMAYQDTVLDLPSIGRELGVSTILEGSVQRAGGEVRVSVQLVDAVNDTQLWARSYKRALSTETIFAIQGEIAADVARSLGAILTPEDLRRLERTPTDSLAALESYFRGHEQKLDGTDEGFRQSVDSFQQAVQQDPKFPEAHAQLADTLLLQIFFSGLPVDEQIARAKPHIDRALVLDPNLAIAHVAQGRVHEFRRESGEAEAAYRRALELKPNSIAALRAYGQFLQSIKQKPEQAVPYFKRALDIAPGEEGIRQQLAETLIASGELDRGEAVLRGTLEDNPRHALSLRTLGDLMCWKLGRVADGVRAYREALDAGPGSQSTAASIALAYEALGDHVNMARWMERAIAIAPESKDVLAYQGLTTAAQGEPRKAAHMLQKLSPESDLYVPAQSRIAYYLRESGDAAAALRYLLARNPGFLDDPPVLERHQAAQAAVATQLLAGEARMVAARRLGEAVLKLIQEDSGTISFGHNWAAIAHLSLGQLDAAIAELQATAEAGPFHFHFVTSRIWAPLTGIPAFEEYRADIMERIESQRFQLEHEEYGAHPAGVPRYR